MTRIVIVGGGFAGAFAAKHLYSKFSNTAQIELFNSTNYFVFQPLLPEVVSGTISAPDAVTPLRIMLPGIKVRMAEVQGVDFENNLIHFVQGSKKIPQQIKYDHLVLTCGQEANLAMLPGFAEHSFAMKNLADAHELRNHIIQCLEHADITNNPKIKQRLLTFVVAGAGFSGVETIGEMFEMLRRTVKFYPNISLDELKGIIVQRDERILTELPSSLSDYASKILSKRGIDIRTGTSIECASHISVTLGDGEVIETSTLVTTVGNGPGELVKSLPIELNRGKIPSNEFMQVQGYENVWSLGDSALIPLAVNKGEEQSYAPPTAQFAVQEAKQLANNIYNVTHDKTLKAFAYKPKGALASIGNYKAVAELFGMKFSGLPAWLLWRTFYIGMLPGFVTRLRVALNWLLDFFVPRNIVQINNQSNRKNNNYECYAKGEIIYEAGQIIDGLYTVVSGSLESKTKQDGSEDFIRVLKPGDHWGERTISGDFTTVSTLSALEDSKVLILKREVFQQLKQSFPPFEEYFSGIEEHVYPEQLRKTD